MSEWTEAIHNYVRSRNVPDRECKELDVPLFMCCAQLRCRLCYNWHRKWVHEDEFSYVVRDGNMVRSQYSFYPDEIKQVLFQRVERSSDASFVDQLSDAELRQLYDRLKIRD